MRRAAAMWHLPSCNTVALSFRMVCGNLEQPWLASLPCIMPLQCSNQACRQLSCSTPAHRCKPENSQHPILGPWPGTGSEHRLAVHAVPDCKRCHPWHKDQLTLSCIHWLGPMGVHRDPWDFVRGGRAPRGTSRVLAATEGCCMSRFRVNQNALSAVLSG